jgi:DNA topoisomerase IB
MRRAGSVRVARRHVVEAVAAVAAKLGNTPSICRKCYIHPAILTGYGEGKLAALNGAAAPQALRKLLSAGRRGARRTRPTLQINMKAARTPRPPTAAQPPTC